MKVHTLYDNFCQALKAKGQWRELATYQPSQPGQIRRNVEDFVNFSSNDYMGLSRHRLLRARAISYAQQYGTGSTASRLMGGNWDIFSGLEEKLAKSVGTESSLIFNSGYQANSTVLQALLDPAVLGMEAIAFCDRLNHNSIWQGVKLAGAQLSRYAHLDLNHLESLLQKSMQKKAARFIISETLFGMDGDKADVEGLIALAEKYDAFLYLDDAHAVGVYGARGYGLAADYNGRIDCIMGTFGKGLGGFGAYIGCDAKLRDYLINRCGGFMFATALPPTVLGACEASLDIVPGLSVERARLLANAEYLRSALKSMGYNTAQSTSHIVPIVLGSEGQATRAQFHLGQMGVLAVAVRPPTVPQGTSRLRLSLTALHQTAHLDQAIRAFDALRGEEKMKLAA